LNTVWILDRTESDAAELVRALPALVYDVAVWTDADALLSSIREEAPDLVIIEHGIASPPAVEILRQIKSARKRLPVVVVAARTSSQGAIESMREGAYDYLPRETLPAGLEDAARRALSPDGGMIRTIGSPGPGDVAELGAIVGKTPEMVEIEKLIGQVATTDATVLIHGESGTGKELIARAVHYNSSRRERPFVAVNCAALPGELLDAELFGRGAERGPERRELPRFEQADRGTIFLDEIDAAGLPAQGRLLSVLENGAFERPGTRAKVRVNVRVIAATGKSMVQKTKDGSFRVDLFYRLKVVSLFIPPLRDRRDDISHLALYFLGRAKEKMHRDVDGMSPQVYDLLKEYPWPGNVSELEQAIERAVALNRSGVLVPADFDVLRGGPDSWPAAGGPTPEGALESASRAEMRRLIAIGRSDVDRAIVSHVGRAIALEALREADGNQVKAAKLIGISRNTLRKRLREDAR
jgi:DNA-binding NtrC family response regulator